MFAVVCARVVVGLCGSEFVVAFETSGCCCQCFVVAALCRQIIAIASDATDSIVPVPARVLLPIHSISNSSSNSDGNRKGKSNKY